MVLLKDFPELRQTYNYDCGTKALQSVLAYYGIDVREDNLILLTQATEDGATPVELIRAVEQYGLTYDAREMTIDALKDFITKGVPIITPLQAWTETPHPYWENDWIDGHYVVAIGYDDQRVIFEDPSSFQRTYLSYEDLEKRWHDVDKNGTRYIHYGIAVYGKEPVSRKDPIPMG